MSQKKLTGMSLAEIIIAILIGSILLTLVTLIYYYTSQAGKQGFEVAEAQQSIEVTLNELMRDLRTTGSDVSSDICGIDKKYSIGNATSTAITIYGNFMAETGTPKIEKITYSITTNSCLLKQMYSQSGTGTGSTWTNIIKEKVLIGKKPYNKSRIKVKSGTPAGFALKYLNDNQQEISDTTNKDERALIRRVDISIIITNYNGKIILANGMNSTGLLRNLTTPEGLESTPTPNP